MGTALTLVATAGAIGMAGPAFAGVTVSPATVPQGSGQNLTYHVVNDGAAALTRVTLRIPADSPIAEVYPLSVDDWAPMIEWQNLSTPLKTIHNGTPVTQVPKSITWIAVGGKSIAPGGSADLSVALGPLPTLSSMQFSLVGTYADGKTAPAMTASLTLTPDATGAAGHGHDTTGGDAAADEDELFRQAVADAEQNARGYSVLAIAGWVVAGFALLGAGWIILRNRHRASEEPDDSPSPEDEAGEDRSEEKAAADDEREVVAAGRWSLRD
ncbi:DUF1775 domain-containing protein [Actinoplanes regularis]|uniref:DUF1775 domain-containing protein n=1 Tax=Actinoplanes regularis TaxID=52697 RepID=UPI0025538B50|nr:DUF1775 domain-containing protein [Actinoplanes regularis]GLW27942.1 hypothetical protein Areg01_08820 [Actinoplanes regularis]